MQAVIYLRISQDRTGQEAGVDRQRTDVRALAQRRGWEVVAECVDNDTSAAGKRKRPGFEQVMAAVTSGQVGAVVAWDMTRLLRTARDRLRMLEAGKEARTVLAFARGSDLDLSTPAGRLTADLLGAMALHEIEQKSDRQKAANLQAAQKGRRAGGRRPLGYEQDGVTIRPVEADAVRDGFDALLAGENLSEIAREWNARGLRTDQVGWKSEVLSPWRADSVRAVLRNPRYVALRALNGEVMGPAAWPALIAEETFAAVQAVLDGNAGRRVAPRVDITLLSGIARCGVCDAPVRGGRTVDKARTYRCRGAYGHVVRAAEPVEEYVSALVVARLSRPDAAELLVDTARAPIDAQALRSEAQAVRIGITEVATDFALGKLPKAAYETARARGNTRLAEIEDALADAGRVNVLGPLVAARDVEAAWEHLSVPRRREVLDALLEVRLLPPGRGTRTFRPESVQITWRTG